MAPDAAAYEGAAAEGVKYVIPPQVAQTAPIEAAVRGPKWTVTKTRCARCADEAAPADLPVLVERGAMRVIGEEG